MKKIHTVSVIGLGKLGFPLALFYAQKYNVAVFDKSESRMKLFTKQKASHTEPLASLYLKNYHKRINRVKSIKEAVMQSDVSFIVVPTPSEKSGNFSTSFVLSAIREVALSIKNNNKYHLIVLVSTVLPGTFDKDIFPLIEKETGKKIGKDVGLCYSPEFIALGSVIHNLTYPDFILIGESDVSAGEILAKLKLSLCKNKPSVRRMNFVNAELTKISLNSYITMKMSFANMIARISEKIPSANVDTVTEALGLDTRIGKKYLKGAVAYGGPCFPRDNYALSYTAGRAGIKANIPIITHRFNKAQNDFLIDFVSKYLSKKQKVGILGLSYKQNTDVIEESPGILLAQGLSKKNYSVYVYDPAALPQARKLLGNKAKYAKSAQSLIKTVDVVVLVMMWDEFFDLNKKIFTRKKPITIIDCWRARPDLITVPRSRYIPLGIYIQTP